MNVRQKLSLAALCITLPALASAQAAPAAEPAAAPAAAPAPAPAPAAAAAPAASVTVYGTANVNFQTEMAKGATDRTKSVSARDSVSVDSSNIGVKASADVGYGLGVTGQCETSANLDGINTSGLLCGRNSRVGVTSAFGTLFYGNWDTPFKAVAYGTKVDDPFMNTDVFGFQSLMGSPGFNYRSGSGVTAAAAAPDTSAGSVAGSVVTGFDVRAPNSVAFHSAKVMGASVKLQYSASEFGNVKGDFRPELYGAAVNYDIGGFSVLAAYERHEAWSALAGINTADKVSGTPASIPEQLAPKSAAFGATRPNLSTHNSTDWAWRVGAGYQLDSPFGATTVSALVDQLILGQDRAVDGAVKEYKRLAWQVALKHRMGNHELRARYNSADKGDCKLVGGAACSTTGYGANQITVGYALHLSKAAQAYVSYTRITNEQKASYTLSIGGAPAVAGATPAGADPQALGLGIRYTF